MKYSNKKYRLITCLFWLTGLLATGNLASAQAENKVSAPVEILMAEPQFAGSSASSTLFLQAKKYHDANGVKQDFLRARSLYLKAANMGNNAARINLGYMYFMGEGVAQSYLKARNWYLSAANNGSKAAQLNLAMIYQNGFGVAKDIQKAEYWRMYDYVKPVKQKPIAKPVVQAPITVARVKKTFVPKPVTKQVTLSEVKTRKPIFVQEAKVLLPQAAGIIPISQSLIPQIAINKAAVLLSPLKTLRSLPLRSESKPQPRSLWFSTTLAILMLVLVFVSSGWFFVQYTTLAKQKKARVFAKAFYTHHRDRLRVHYLHYPQKQRKIDTMDGSWATTLCVLMVRFAQGQKDEDSLVGMQSNKIVQALKESPYKAKQVVFPFVKITQHRIFDDIRAHDYNFKAKPEIAKALPVAKVQELVPKTAKDVSGRTSATVVQLGAVC